MSEMDVAVNSPIVEEPNTLLMASEEPIENTAEPTLMMASDPEDAAVTEGQEEQSVEDSSIPEAYDIQVMDGYELPEELLAEITPLLKKHKLSQEAAQELANAHMDIMNRQRVLIDQSQKELIKSWVTEIKEDPEFGGINFAKNMSLAKRGLNAIMPTDAEGKEAVSMLLNEGGMGNNPHMIKMFAKVGAMVKEDSLLDKGKSGSNQAEFDANDMFAETLAQL